VIIINITGLEISKLELLGKGSQGRVYRIDSERCIKIFKKHSACYDETKAFFMALGDEHFPQLYSAGPNYIIRECINGIELDRYLSRNELTMSISEKIIGLYEAMKKVKFKRLDSALFHIFVTTEGKLRVIDTAKALKKKTIYPRLLLKGLEQLGYKDKFLNYVQYIRPDLYNVWK